MWTEIVQWVSARRKTGNNNDAAYVDDDDPKTLSLTDRVRLEARATTIERRLREELGRRTTT